MLSFPPLFQAHPAVNGHNNGLVGKWIPPSVRRKRAEEAARKEAEARIEAKQSKPERKVTQDIYRVQIYLQIKLMQMIVMKMMMLMIADDKDNDK